MCQNSRITHGSAPKLLLLYPQKSDQAEGYPIYFSLVFETYLASTLVQQCHQLNSQGILTSISSSTRVQHSL